MEKEHKEQGKMVVKDVLEICMNAYCEKTLMQYNLAPIEEEIERDTAALLTDCYRKGIGVSTVTFYQLGQHMTMRDSWMHILALGAFYDMNADILLETLIKEGAKLAQEKACEMAHLYLQ